MVCKVCQSCCDTGTDGTCSSCKAAQELVSKNYVNPSEKSAGAWSWLTGTPAGLIIGLVLLVIGGGVIIDRVLEDTRAEKGTAKTPAKTTEGHFPTGIHISELGRLLDKGTPESPSNPQLRYYFPANERGDGTIDYEGDGLKLKIHFEGGLVTSIEESPSSAGPGFHRCSTVVRKH
jgi:hypothetical protein